MHFTTSITSSGKLASLAFLLLGFHPSAVNSVTFDCKQVVIGDVKLDLSPLTGPHSVSMLQRTPTAIKNTTFTLDICKPLYKSGDKPKSAECPNGSRGKWDDFSSKYKITRLMTSYSLRARAILPS